MSALSVKKTVFKQYFTDASDVNFTMAKLLGNVDGLCVLEPSVGNGALLTGLIGAPDHIDAVDVDPSVLSSTLKRLPNLNIDTHNVDYIDLFVDSGLFGRTDPLMQSYDAVISNPPFGLFFSTEYRKRLKTKYPKAYVRESYGLFLMFSIMKLKPGGKYVFLVPDTFLTSKNHSPLRRYIFEHGQPSHIVRFPSKRFETVNFGYGNLCIIAGNKSRTTQQHLLTWHEAFDDTAALLDQPASTKYDFAGRVLDANIESGWRASMDGDRPEINGWATLGDVADCKTGIYTGDNTRFIGFDPSRVNKRLNGHSIGWDMVRLNNLASSEVENGLDGEQRYVPLIRGGHRSFNECTAWALRWDAEALRFYKTDKKARLQNAGYYFREGLAVPMVTAKRLSASLMNGSVFDQGVVGVFLHDIKAREAMLLYLNSSLATELRNEIVNGSANNSANYLKRLPVPRFTSEQKVKARGLVAGCYEKKELPINVCDSFTADLLTTLDTQ